MNYLEIKFHAEQMRTGARPLPARWVSECINERAELVRFIDEFAAAGRAMIRAYGNCGSPMQQQAADALQALIAKAGL